MTGGMAMYLSACLRVVVKAPRVEFLNESVSGSCTATNTGGSSIHAMLLNSRVGM